MRWLRVFFRIFGWLLTPFLAWAASFFGAVVGALLALKLDDPVRGWRSRPSVVGLPGLLPHRLAPLPPTLAGNP